MQHMQPWEPAGGTSPLRRAGNCFGAVIARTGALGASLGMALCVIGCASITTPLPDLRPRSSTAMSQPEQQRAMDELNRKRDTHEEEAERQIEAVK